MKKIAIILISSFIFALGLSAYKTILAITHPIKYESIIETQAKVFSIPSYIIASVINVESSYDEKAISNKQALGLMQIKLSTAQYVCNYYKLDEMIEESDLLDAEKNIEYGCRYLRYLINKFDDIYTALSAYNAGETRVRVWLKDKNFSIDGKTLYNIPYKETDNYIKKIKKNIKFYEKIYK